MLLLIVIAIFSLILVYIVKWYLHLFKYRNLNVPGPTPLPIFGNIFQVGTQLDDILGCFRKLQKDYGGIFKLYLGPNTVSVMLSDPKYIQHILRSTEHINKTNMYKILGSILGDGLAFVQGERWRKNRKLFGPSFDLTMLKGYNNTFNLSSDSFMQKIKEITKKEIDIGPYVNSYTHRVISETSMGIEYNENLESHVKFVNAVDTCFHIAVSRIFSLTGISDFLFNLTKDSKILEENIRYCRNYTDSIITQRLKQKRNLIELKEDQFGAKQKTAFLDLLLDIYEIDQNMTIEDVREEVDTILVAGNDTTSSTLSFLLYELSLNPHIQEKIFEEICSIFQDKDENFIKLEEMNKMFYTECAIKECLRKHTIIPLIERLIVEDTEIEGVKIPAGTNVTILTSIMHNSEEIYPNPEKFDPERFFPEQVALRKPYSFIPFSMGPRNCIGKRFAMYEMKSLLAKLIRHYRLKPVKGFKIEYMSNIVSKSKFGYPVILEPRNEI